MSALLNASPKAGGRILLTNGLTPPSHFVNGLPYEANGELAVSFGGVIDHYHQGLAFDVEGRLVVTGATPGYFGSGSAGFVSDRMVVHTTADATHYVHGVGYQATGRAITETG